MTAIFKNSRLKVKRANEHIDELIRRSSSLPPELYEFTNGPARSHAIFVKPNCFQFTYEPKESITEYFSAIIGDAVNNLREALEYWINALSRHRGGTGKLHFPFSSDWEDFETSPNYPPVKKALPDLADFIRDEIKPCRNTNLQLWAATSLCNFNKHNDFVPTVSLMRFDIDTGAGSSGISDLALTSDANKRAVILESEVGPIRINKKKFRTTVEITFPEGAIFENQPVIPTLAQMSQVVSTTLDALDKFAANSL